MEESLPSPQISKKRMFPDSGSVFIDLDDDVSIVASPLSRTPKSCKGKEKEVIVPDVIEIEDDEDFDTTMLMDKKQVGRSNKGKAIKYSSDDYPDHQAKGVVANSYFGSSSKGVTSASHKVNYSDYFLDDVIDVDEYARRQSLFDNVDIAPGVEAPMPPIPWLLDPPKSKTAVPGSSSLDMKYGAAKSFVSASHNVIDLDCPSYDPFNSKGGYTGLYLDDFMDTNEYAQMLAHSDKVDIPPAKEAPIPHIPSFSRSRSRGNAVSRRSSSLKNQMDVSHSFGISSSSRLPQVPSNNSTQSYLQHQGNAVNLPVGVGSSEFQTDTQENNVPAEQVTSIDTDETMEKLKGCKQFYTVEDHSDHHYTKSSNSTMQKNWAKKIQEEWRILEKDLPDMIFVRVYETRMDLLRAVIIGAEGTPYHDGLFFFDVSFPSAYPNVPPNVYYHSGGLRLNPNLYACGKVCLSLLNTWSGGKNEKWIRGKSTMLQVLVSIQGLILNTEPYFNEPGYASMKGKSSGKQASKKYNEDTFMLSLRTMVYMMRKPPKYFEDFVMGHFRSRAHDILGACKSYIEGAEVGCLVKGRLESVNGNQSCSLQFRHSVAGYLPTLVSQFTQIGAKDCEKFLSTVVNKENGSMPRVGTPRLSSSGSMLHAAKPMVPSSLKKKAPSMNVSTSHGVTVQNPSHLSKHQSPTASSSLKKAPMTTSVSMSQGAKPKVSSSSKKIPAALSWWMKRYSKS